MKGEQPDGGTRHPVSLQVPPGGVPSAIIAAQRGAGRTTARYFSAIHLNFACSWSLLLLLLLTREGSITTVGDFPGGPVAKTPCSQCRAPRFKPWSGN